MSDNHFSTPLSTLLSLGERILALASELGATSAETELSEGSGQSVTVRNGDIETIEYNRDKSISVTVYDGHKKGSATTSNFSDASIRDTVEKAVSIAKHTAEDPCSGLADASLMEIGQPIPDLNLFHPWDITTDEAVELAKACEQAAFDTDKTLRNSEGASISTQKSQFALLNSKGFAAGAQGTRHSVYCSVIAGPADAMQRDGWYEVARDAKMLPPLAEIGAIAARRAAARVGAKKIPTTKVPVLFEAPVAASLIGHLISAASGGRLYRKASFLLDKLGDTVMPSFVQMLEQPLIEKGLASAAFDSDAVRTKDRGIIADGVLAGYFLSAYTARKLDMEPTGNADGPHNLWVSDTGDDYEALIRKMDKGVIITELLGDGVDYVTGNYSRGATGFWVENGQIQYPIEEITIAGNLADMFKGIVAIGNDRRVLSSRQCGSILIDEMTVAGA